MTLVSTIPEDIPAPELYHESCPVCGGKMIIRHGMGIDVIECKINPDHPSYMRWRFK